MRGLLEEDEGLVRVALDAIFKEVRVTTDPEGIQPDWSFHQHGPQLYQGNYGAHFMETNAPYVRLLSDTPFAMPTQQVEALARMMVDGTAWISNRENNLRETVQFWDIASLLVSYRF